MIDAIINNPITKRIFSGLVILAVIPTLFILLPVISVPSGISEALTYLINILWQWDFIFPVNTMLWGLGIYITLEIATILIKVGLWVYQSIDNS